MRTLAIQKTYLYGLLTMAKVAGPLLGIEDTGELRSPQYNLCARMNIMNIN